MISLAVFAAAAMLCADPTPIRDGPATPAHQETDAQRTARHAAIAKARQGTILLAHRGAATIAPENTLDAVRAALRLGCGAVKLDFRRTLDGVVVLYHDNRLEHRLDIFGTVETSYNDELLLALPRHRSSGQAWMRTFPPCRKSLRSCAKKEG